MLQTERMITLFYCYHYIITMPRWAEANRFSAMKETFYLIKLPQCNRWAKIQTMLLFISVDWEVRGMWGDDAHCYILIIRSVTNTLPLSLSRNENIKQRVSGLCDPLRFHTITHYQFCTPNASLLIPYLILMRTDEHLTLYWGRRELLRKREIYTQWKLVTSVTCLLQQDWLSLVLYWSW